MSLIKRTVKFLIILGFVGYFGVVGWVYTHQRSLIFHPRPLGKETPNEYGVQYEDVRFPSLDSTNLDGWWIPRDEDQKRRISLLYCHGNGASLSMLSHVAAIFHSYGVDTFMFDYRGFGRSDAGQSGLSEELVGEDALSALNWIREKRPNQKVIVWGHSLGSSVAASLGVSQQLSGLVLEGAFTSLADMAQHRYPYVPVVTALLQDRFETANYLSTRKQMPLLELHAENDSVIPIELGRKAFERAAGPKQWLLVQGVDHNDFPEVHEQYRSVIEGWLDRL